LGEAPPIMKSLKLHKQPLVLHAWKVVERAVVGYCQVAYIIVQFLQLKNQQDTTVYQNFIIPYFK
jgi:hypothetical protein